MGNTSVSLGSGLTRAEAQAQEAENVSPSRGSERKESYPKTRTISAITSPVKSLPTKQQEVLRDSVNTNDASVGAVNPESATSPPVKLSSPAVAETVDDVSEASNHGDLYHTFVCGGTSFTVYKEYEDPKFIGKGAYGAVCSVTHRKTGDRMAIKKILDVQEMDNIDAMRMLREVKILRHVRGHPQMVCLEQVVPPLGQTTGAKIDEIYLICEYMPRDLGRTIRLGILKDEMIPKILYGILKGIDYLHQCGIMHRDMKPRNILIDDEANVRIADFGLAIGAAGKTHQLINYVVTRWYRAPELLLECKVYDKAIDIWSIGCILGEMLARRPLFRGNNAKEQLKLILSVLGKPTEEDLEFVDKKKYKNVLLQMKDQEPKEWVDILPKATIQGIDLLEQFLCFSPTKRCSVEDAMNHPYLSMVASTWDEKLHVDPTQFPFVTEDIDVKEILGMLAEEANTHVVDPST